MFGPDPMTMVCNNCRAQVTTGTSHGAFKSYIFGKLSSSRYNKALNGKYFIETRKKLQQNASNPTFTRL